MTTGPAGPKNGSSTQDRSSKPDYLGAFEKLGPHIYYHRPDSKRAENGSARATDTATATASGVQPDLIIICSWMGASSRHIAKYTDEYLARHPTVPTLLVRCSQFDMMFKPERLRIQDMKPAAISVQSVLSNLSNRRPRVLMHIFSNGGGWTASVLSAAYERATDGSTLPLTALVFDSCPSYPRMQSSHHALAMFLPKNFIVTFIGSMLIWLLLIVIRIQNLLGISNNVVLKMRKSFNDPAQVFIKGGVPRVYICSKSDVVVSFEDVQSHAEEAKAAMKRTGIKDQEVHKRVKLEEFQNSPHVGHLMVDGKRYWKVVEKVWEEGMRVQDSKAQ